MTKVIQAVPQMEIPEYIIGEGTPDRPKRVQQKEYDPLRDPIGYRWPASRLSAANMKMLKKLSIETRRPITKLLQEAVEIFCEANRNDQTKLTEPVAVNESLNWTGEPGEDNQTRT